MNERLQVYEDKMKKTMASLESDLATIRAGRANPNVLNKIMVDYYGTPTPIQQVGNVSVPEPRMILIQPWGEIDGKGNREGHPDFRAWASIRPTMDPPSGSCFRN